MKRTNVWIVVLGLGLTGWTSGAEAQGVPVVEQSQQPPGYGQPGYGQPGYGQPGYGGRRERIEYHEGMHVPPGGEVVSRLRLGMLIPGVALFAVSYIGTLAAWAISEDAGGSIQDIVLAPVVGPYIAAARTDRQSRKVGAAFMGIMQTVGLGLFIGGLVPKKYLVYYASGWELRPHAGFGGAGLDLSLRF